MASEPWQYLRARETIRALSSKEDMLRIAEMQSRVPYNDGAVDYATDKVFCVQVSMPETANVRRAEKIIKRWGRVFRGWTLTDMYTSKDKSNRSFLKFECGTDVVRKLRG